MTTNDGYFKRAYRSLIAARQHQADALIRRSLGKFDKSTLDAFGIRNRLP